MARKPIDQRAGEGIKNILNKMIQNVSVFAIFIILGVVTLTYAGAEFNLAGIISGGIGVSSLLLTIGNIILYELWMKNGQTNGREEEEYKQVIKDFEEKSKNIASKSMQDFIVWEEARRYDVEERKIASEIAKIDEKLLKENLSQKTKTRLILHKQNLQEQEIKVDMPYKVSEEFDELRYSIKEAKHKEYKPNDTNKFIKRNRIQKYTLSAIFTMFSINLIVMEGSITNNWWGVLLAVVLSAIVLMIAIVTGFSNGYSSIMGSSLGVYKTANDFIDKANAWCKAKNISLYFVEKTYVFSVNALDRFIPEDLEMPEDEYKPTLRESFGRQEVIIT